MEYIETTKLGRVLVCAVAIVLIGVLWPAVPASSQALTCDVGLNGPTLRKYTSGGVPMTEASASGWGNCDSPSPSLTLVVGVHAAGAGMHGWNPYTRQNASYISGSVSAGFGAAVVCYTASAELIPAGKQPVVVTSPCRGVAEDE